MPQTEQTFTRHNTDDSELSRPTSDFTAAVNIALDFGGIRPQRGNVLVPYDLPATGLSKRLGGFEDGVTGTAVSLLYNSMGTHRLIRYDPVANTENTLLEWAGLNLSADLILHGGILDGLLLYLDNIGAVRCVNLKRAANGEYTTALLTSDPYALHLVKRPPTIVPAATRLTNADPADPRSSFNLTHGTSWQFAYRYRYVDGDVTPLGTYSAVMLGLAPPAPNLAGVLAPPTNFLRINTPTLPPLVEVIELCVRQDAQAQWLVATEIRRTNTAPFVDFYGRTLGTALTTAEAAKTAEALPIRLGTLTVARSRAMGGDCTEGYMATSMAFTVSAASDIPAPIAGSTQVRVWRSVRTVFYTDGRDSTTTTAYAILTGSIPYPDPASVYDLVDYDPNTGTYSNPKGLSISYALLFTNYNPEGYETQTTVTDLSLFSVQAAVAGGSTGTFTFKGRTTYSTGVQFYDAQGRPGGVQAIVAVPIPALAYSYAQPDPSGFSGTRPLPTTLHWALPTTDPLLLNAEIPAWADTYTICIGPNQTAIIFLQFRANDVRRLAGRDVTDKPLFSALGSSGNTSGKLWVDIGGISQGISTLGETKFGYTWVADSGDQLRFLASNTTALITGQYGNYIEINYSGPTPSTTPAVEIFTPSSIDLGTTFYEHSIRYRVLRDSADGPRSYQVSAGTLTGDVVLIQREGYNKNQLAYLGDNTFAWYEAMNARNEQATAWLDMRRGRPAFAVPGGSKQVRRKNLIRFGGVKVQGTLLNGLSQWEPLSQYEDIPQEQGAITRLIIADQTQTDGSILLVTQEQGSESVSLSRSQIQAADGQPLLAISKQVIGGSNALRGGFGCTDPAAVTGFGGMVFFPCRSRAEVMRYDRNGLTPLGLTHKTSNRLKVVFARYAAAKITACYDPRRKEYLLTFHATGSLPDLTLIYSQMHEAWSDEVTCSPESGMGVGNELISWLGGQLWRHTPDAPTATFFGVVSPVTVTFITSQPGGRMTKVWRRIAINSYGLWLPTRLTNKENQLSRVLPSWLKYAGGIWRAALRRDETTPGQPNPAISLHEGDELQSAALKVTLTAEVGKNDLLTAASLEYYFSSGQGGGS